MEDKVSEERKREAEEIINRCNKRKSKRYLLGFLLIGIMFISIVYAGDFIGGNDITQLDTLHTKYKSIEIRNTDDNTGEDLIIKTDKGNYSSLSGFDFYTSVYSENNLSGKLIITMPSCANPNNFEIYSTYNLTINTSYYKDGIKEIPCVADLIGEIPKGTCYEQILVEQYESETFDNWTSLDIKLQKTPISFIGQKPTEGISY